MDACRTTTRLIDENGRVAEMLALPEQEIYGNSHLLMQDNNSTDIAGMVIGWLNTLGE